MIVIGEKMNIMSNTIGPAMKGREAKPIQELAKAQAEAGADYLDLNLGPARKAGAEMMEWVVKTIQEVIDLPLFLDTTNVEAVEAGLKCYQQKKGKAVINSVSARPERMEALLPLAKRYDAGIVALVLGVEGIPRDAAERGSLAAELMYKAQEAGIENGDIWIDPIVLPVNTQQNQVQGCTEFMTMFKDLAPECKSTCGLSNVSNGSPEHLRPILNQTYMIMLQKHGMYSCILDPFDEGMMRIAKGGKEDIVKLIYRVMDGEEIDLGSLSKEEVDFVKTTKVLLGQSLYSDSWLEL